MDAETQQPYSYASDDPINGTDPTGLDDTIPISAGSYSGQSLATEGSKLAALCQTTPSACNGPSFSDVVAIVNRISDYAGIAAGACAVTMFWNGVGEACLAAGAVAGAVNATTDAIQVAEGRRSLGSAAISVIGDILLGGAGSKVFSAGTDIFKEATTLRDSGGIWNRTIGGFGRFVGQATRLQGAALNAAGNVVSNLNAASADTSVPGAGS